MLLGSTILFAALASEMPTTPPWPDPKIVAQACTNTGLNPTTLVHLRSLAVADWKVVPKSQPEPIYLLMNTGKVLGYTRLHIVYLPCSALSGRDYTLEQRNMLKRYFLGKHAQKVVTISARVSPNDIPKKAIVAMIQRDSDKHGEGWNTQILNNAIPLPYFRVDQGSTIQMSAAVRSTREYASSIGSGVIDVVTAATKLIAPQASVITAANKARFTDAANFVDTALNGLLKVSIDEQNQTDAVLAPVDGDQLLAVYSVNLPFANDVFYASGHARLEMGAWAIFAERLRPSVLGDVVGGALSVKSVSSPAILGLMVDQAKTLREALAGTATITNARDDLVKVVGKLVKGKPAAAVEDSAYRLCRLIEAKGEHLELTPIDASAIAWAYIDDLGLPASPEASAHAGCRRIGRYPN